MTYSLYVESTSKDDLGVKVAIEFNTVAGREKRHPELEAVELAVHGMIEHLPEGRGAYRATVSGSTSGGDAIESLQANITVTVG